MKGVPIKFRGKDKNGYLFGSHHILKDGSHVIIDEGSWYYGRVYPDTVAQLVGYDKDGNEVYEDDKLILGSHEYIAGIRPVSYTDDKKYYKPEKDFSDFLIKEV